MKGRHAPRQQQQGHYEGLLVPIPKRRDAASELAVNHVPKKAKTAKGLEVVFDPAKHKDFITGFRKRKQQRRKVAEQQIKKKEREDRLANRAEKRAKLKEELGLDDKWGASSSDEAEEEQAGTGAEAADPTKPHNVAVYDQQGTRTIVTTAPLSLHSESEKEEDPEDDAPSGPAVASKQPTRQNTHISQKQKGSLRKGKIMKHTGGKKRNR